MNTRSNSLSRRQVLKAAVGTTLATLPSNSAPARAAPNLPVIEIDPQPTHELSPYLYMQFMEPLGTNDSSVEASWDHLHDRWHPDLIEKTRSLSPSMIRWEGLFCSYYRWREAVGPREARIPMYNIVWGGIESKIAPRNLKSIADAIGRGNDTAPYQIHRPINDRLVNLTQRAFRKGFVHALAGHEGQFLLGDTAGRRDTHSRRIRQTPPVDQYGSEDTWSVRSWFRGSQSNSTRTR